MKQLESELGITEAEGWYQVSRENMVRNIGHIYKAGCLKEFVQSMRDVYPTHQWDIDKFANFSKRGAQQQLKSLLQRYFTELCCVFLTRLH